MFLTFCNTIKRGGTKKHQDWEWDWQLGKALCWFVPTQALVKPFVRYYSLSFSCSKNNFEQRCAITDGSWDVPYKSSSFLFCRVNLTQNFKFKTLHISTPKTCIQIEVFHSKQKAAKNEVNGSRIPNKILIFSLEPHTKKQI